MADRAADIDPKRPPDFADPDHPTMAELRRNILRVQPYGDLPGQAGTEIARNAIIGQRERQQEKLKAAPAIKAADDANQPGWLANLSIGSIKNLPTALDVGVEGTIGTMPWAGVKLYGLARRRPGPETIQAGKGFAYAGGAAIADRVGSYLNDNYYGSSRLGDFLETSNPNPLYSIGEPLAMGAVPLWTPPKWMGGNSRIGRGLQIFASWAVPKGIAFWDDWKHDRADHPLSAPKLDSQTEDHQKQTPASMEKAVDELKGFGLSTNSNGRLIRSYAVADSGAIQYPDLNSKEGREARRDLAAASIALGELMGEKTPVYEVPTNGHPFPNTALGYYMIAKNALTELRRDRSGRVSTDHDNELDMPQYISDPATGALSVDSVTKRLYSDMGKILDPNPNLLADFNKLKTMVRENDPRFQKLSEWLSNRRQFEEERLFQEKQSDRGAPLLNEPFQLKLHNFVLADILQRQALLDMARAASMQGQQKEQTLENVHEALNQVNRIGWDGLNLKVNGEQQSQKRQSDLPRLIEMYMAMRYGR